MLAAKTDCGGRNGDVSRRQQSLLIRADDADEELLAEEEEEEEQGIGEDVNYRGKERKFKKYCEK